MSTRNKIIWTFAVVAFVLSAMSLAFVFAPQRQDDLNKVVRLKSAKNSAHK